MANLLLQHMETREIVLLIDLDTLQEPFYLKEAMTKFNRQKLNMIGFYSLFFGLQTLGLIRVAHLPEQVVDGKTNITYQLTSAGKEMIQEYKILFLQ